MQTQSEAVLCNLLQSDRHFKVLICLRCVQNILGADAAQCFLGYSKIRSNHAKRCTLYERWIGVHELPVPVQGGTKM
jgi:hypothetical protein